MRTPAAAAVHEQALMLDCSGEALPAVLSTPAAGEPATEVGVVVVVGGPQYRVGSHRQFVLLARALAGQGHSCLRFDYRGMGDASGAARDFQQVDADLAVAIDALRQARPQLRHVLLWGLCDAVSAILLYLDRQGPRQGVDGLVLLNPWVRSELGLARTQVKHYYLQRLREREFWLKLLSGRTGLAALGEFLGKLRQVLGARRGPAQAADLPYQERMARAWRAFPGPMLLQLSGDDFVAKEFLDHAAGSPHWQGLLQRPGLEHQDLAEADHTFSRALWRDAVAAQLLDWIARHFPAQRAG